MLDRAHFLCYRRELCDGLAEATGDETYLKTIGVDTSLAEFGDE